MTERKVPQAMIPRVKICCIGSPEEARTAIEMGAAALGLVSEMPSGPGVISEEMIALIASQTAPPTATFLLTARQTARGIPEQQRRCRTTTLQLVDHVPHSELATLRDALPGIGIVQVIHVDKRDSVPVPVILAGGLTAENVVAAIDAVQPFGIDLCSGVRSEGRLDPFKLDAFMRAVGRGD